MTSHREHFRAGGPGIRHTGSHRLPARMFGELSHFGLDVQRGILSLLVHAVAQRSQ